MRARPLPRTVTGVTGHVGDPWAYWATDPYGPFTPHHQARRNLSVRLASAHQRVDALVPPPAPPFAATDAVVAACVTHGDHARAASVFHSPAWFRRDASHSHRFLADQVRDDPSQASYLLAAFDLLDALVELDVELSHKPRVFWERTRALVEQLSTHHSHTDGSSTWWLVQLAASAHHKSALSGAPAPPLSEWLEEVPQAAALLQEHSLRILATGLARSLAVSPLTLAELATACG